MKAKLELKTLQIPAELFNKIVDDWSSTIKMKTPEQFNAECLYGNGAKYGIFYDGKDRLMLGIIKAKHYCPELNNMIPDIQKKLTWYQVIFTKNEEFDVPAIQESMSGCRAYNIVKNKKILKYYSQAEYEDILNSYTTEYNVDLIQKHYLIDIAPGKVYKFTNTFKYDINGAHAFLLTKIFPKAKDEIISIYNERKSKPQNKKLLNYYVGYLKHLGYDGIYNYIVQEVTKMLNNYIDLVGGDLLYANTDGFIVTNIKNFQKTSAKLGEFKLEFQGDTYICYGDNYYIIQQDNDKKGSAPNKVRKDIDLKIGQIVSYKTIRKPVSTSYIEDYEITDIKKLQIKEIN